MINSGSMLQEMFQDSFSAGLLNGVVGFFACMFAGAMTARTKSM